MNMADDGRQRAGVGTSKPVAVVHVGNEVDYTTDGGQGSFSHCSSLSSATKALLAARLLRKVSATALPN